MLDEKENVLAYDLDKSLCVCDPKIRKNFSERNLQEYSKGYIL